MVNKEFVPYQPALELKELGFDEPCLAAFVNEKLKGCGAIYFEVDGLYNNFGIENEEQPWIAAPTWQSAFRWFREKYQLFCSIEYSTTNQTDFVITINKVSINDARDEEYKTYEEAELACLRKLIQIVKQKV